MCDSACDCEQVPKATETVSTTTTTLKECRRCGSKPYIILDKIHVECKTCFLESCNKKLRSTIGKTKLLKNNDSILIAYSGSSSSLALLDLIKNSINYDTRREQKLKPSILHVDTRAVYNETSSANNFKDRIENLKSTLHYISSLFPDWPIYYTSLEMIASASDGLKWWATIDSANNCLNNESHKRIFCNEKLIETYRVSLEHLDLTDKQHQVNKDILTLVDMFASSQDLYKFVFVASSATQLANNLLVDVILGNGSTIRSTVDVCDTRTKVPVIRALKDFSKKEIAYYLRARQLKSEPQTNFATLAHRKASIHKVTEDFLSKLYADYPSTYSTLLRTGNKMRD